MFRTGFNDFQGTQKPKTKCFRKSTKTANLVNKTRENETSFKRPA